MKSQIGPKVGIFIFIMEYLVVEVSLRHWPNYLSHECSKVDTNYLLIWAGIDMIYCNHILYFVHVCIYMHYDQKKDAQIAANWVKTGKKQQRIYFNYTSTSKKEQRACMSTLAKKGRKTISSILFSYQFSFFPFICDHCCQQNNVNFKV